MNKTYWKIYLKDGTNIDDPRCECVTYRGGWIELDEYKHAEIDRETGALWWKRTVKDKTSWRNTVYTINTNEIKFLEEVNKKEGLK